MPPEPPRLLLIDCNTGRDASIVAALAEGGWAVDAVSGRDAAQSELGDGAHALVLLVLRDACADGLAAIAALRAPDAPDPAIPILVLAERHAAALADRVAALGGDGTIALPARMRRLAARIASWRPDRADPTREALAAAFGREAIADLVGRFRRQLADALLRIEADGAAARAHRIAGLAGTLGFGEVHQSWLALSLGEPGAASRAATAARRALRANFPEAPLS